MDKIVYILLLALSSVIIEGKAEEPEYPKVQPAIERLLRVQKFLQAWKKQEGVRKMAREAYGFQGFNCPMLQSSAPPTSVHRLMPGDVNVIAAMGDSITAANGAGAYTAIGLLIQYRGVAWSIGGDKNLEDISTLPNVLLKYNPNLHGFSVKTGNTGSNNARLNFAKPGAKSDAMRQQAENLVREMQRDPKVDWENDWKVITVFIGGNDLCDFCENPGAYGVESYIRNVRDGLDILHEHVPRAFVNLVTTVNVTFMSQLSRGAVCNVLNYFECKCASFPENGEAVRLLNEQVEQYTEETLRLAASGRYDTRDDFTVVAQPFFQHTQPPTVWKNGKEVPDMSYFAPDCFHFSTKGQEAAGLALWNNMVEPVGAKRTEWREGEQLECPTKDRPYFYTYLNSN